MISNLRNSIAALLLFGVLIAPQEAEALDCPMMPPSSWYQPVNGGEISPEKQRSDTEARAALEILDRTPIVFRGRIASARYLSDLRKTNVPSSLIVFDQVEILKGRFFRSPTDRKAFIIKEEWCDGSCSRRIEDTWPHGKIVVVGAHPNRFADPSKAVDFDSKRIIYKGRIDAVLGMCGSYTLLPPVAVQLLSAPNEENARLKREYVLRRPGP
ncbi:hypothetical protein [Bradyrhizobium sp. AUGA SZCCT0182]|uniref:hypothetical protein n=1 Tax=Bradyrhizobium sp. AUGA SZCCT0182 TaxID=2807667 RepID=UPI001BA6F85B|nr:hypothetical protein [Bradyrhizobium sp. AUGA SZCCT0182]MBR1234897.1 hypothetical protein [Bradyrhizobium sp. AUGA SZCCT0182]